MKKELLSLQLASREAGGGHPKLHELVRVVSTWRNKERTSRKEKVSELYSTFFYMHSNSSICTLIAQIYVLYVLVA